MLGFSPDLGLLRGGERGETEGFMGPTNDELERAIALFPEAMLVCDPEGRIVSANQQVCALAGYALEDLLTKTLDELADPVEAKSTVRLLPRLQGDARLDLE